MASVPDEMTSNERAFFSAGGGPRSLVAGHYEIDLARPLVMGFAPKAIWLHVGALLGYGTVGYGVALALTRRRLLK